MQHMKRDVGLLRRSITMYNKTKTCNTCKKTLVCWGEAAKITNS